MLFYKIKKYYKVFGFKQTILKIFRQINYNLHFNCYGIYQLSKKEIKNITLKTKNVYFFSNELFSLTSSMYKEIEKYNLLGYKTIYVYTGKERIKTVKNTILSEYKKIEEINANSIKNSIIFEFNSNMHFNNKKGNYVIDYNNYNKSKDVFYSNNKEYEKYHDNISIIVLNYNNKKVIFKCIDNLIKYNNYNYEIIVVDNQSTDGSYEELKKKYKNIKLYRNIKNGCSSGRNLGALHSQKKYLLFLDSDQWPISENWLDPYLEIIEIKKNFGAIGWTGGWFNSEGYAYHTVDNFNMRYMPPCGLCRKDVGYLGAGGLLIKNAFFNQIGGFDINYDPTCYEDTDLSLQIRNNSEEIFYCPYLGIEHQAHQTTKSGSSTHTALINEKGNYFVNKWKKINKNMLKYKK